MNTILMLMILLLPQIAITVIFAITPYLNKKTLCFGVSIPSEKNDLPKIIKIKNIYRNLVILTGILTTVLFTILTVSIKNEAILAVWYSIILIVEIILFLCIYLYAHINIKKIKKLEKWISNNSEVVTIDTSFRKRKLTVSPLWLLLFPVITISTILFTLMVFDSLPEQLPMHFNSAGIPDRWAEKSLRALSIAPFTQLFMSIIFVFAFYMIRKSKQQIDSENPELSLEQNRIFRYRWSVYILLMGIFCLLLSLLIQLSITQLIQGSVMIIVTLVFTLLTLVVTIVLSITTGQSGSRIKVLKRGNATFKINRDDDNLWKLGMFYYNPEDPSLFVEKRFSIGWTNNWGRPLSWIIMVGIIGSIIAFSVISTSLGK